MIRPPSRSIGSTAWVIQKVEPILLGMVRSQLSWVALSTVAETVTENYGTCHENAAQLEALQEWVRAQEGVK